MQLLIRIALLATTAAVVFLNPLYLGRARYYALFALLLVLALIFWVTTWHIGRRRAQRHVGEPIRHQVSGALFSSFTERREWGALVITDEKILFLVRSRARIENVWSIDREQVIRLAIVVAGRKNNLLIATEEEVRYFQTSKPEKLITLLRVPQKE